MNIDSVTISENGRYILLTLPSHWDLQHLERSLRKAKVIAMSAKVKNLLITSKESIFNRSMESVLDISMLFSDLMECVWRIAIVSQDTQSDLSIFESTLAIHELKINHFNNISSAEVLF
ncbi:MAG: hypothetical protein HRT52_04780 [Colwellia sp.]|nr:hypothetical protein [Colwellia sp.]